MHISGIVIRNFRLLESVEMCLEERTTVIVGRNNSGKTSLTELFRCLIKDQAPKFRLEDFSLGVHERFWDAFQMYLSNDSEENIRDVLPSISAELTISYEDETTDLGALSEFVIDLNDECALAQINISYAISPGRIRDLFRELETDRPGFFKGLKERIPSHYRITVEAQDPNDDSNTKAIEFSKLQAVLQAGFINAQRTLDATAPTGRAVLGKILETIFTAASKSSQSEDQQTAAVLKTAISEVQEEIDSNFNNQLISLIPAFNLFGYPGLSDPKLRTETLLEVEQLLSNHTTVGYEGVNGVNLPEAYNGLGPRNLIYVLLKLLEFFRAFTSKQPEPSVHLIFIEEPEAHLHPQMQNVFIRKLSEIAELFSSQYSADTRWPVQFVVTTHSSHIANEAKFDSMRYFIAQPNVTTPGVFSTEIRDLRTGLSGEPTENREFLHKYMTLTRCDLLFADSAILIEGTTERLLLPAIIAKVDADQGADEVRLGSQYLSIMEVGGAYAHRFFGLLDFLNLRSLIITDLDTVDGGKNRMKCKVSTGTHSCNACLNSWFTENGDANPTKQELLSKTSSDKIKHNRRLAFQIPQTSGDACGRSFEDAFLLANPTLFSIDGQTADEREDQSWSIAKGIDKTKFALEHAIETTDWIPPLYIEEGLRWLAEAPALNGIAAPLEAQSTNSENNGNPHA